MGYRATEYSATSTVVVVDTCCGARVATTRLVRLAKLIGPAATVTSTTGAGATRTAKRTIVGAAAAMSGVVGNIGLATVRHYIVAVCVTRAAAAEVTGAGVTDRSRVWVRSADSVATTAVGRVAVRIDTQWAAASKTIRTFAT